MRRAALVLALLAGCRDYDHFRRSPTPDLAQCPPLEAQPPDGCTTYRFDQGLPPGLAQWTSCAPG